MNSPVNTQTNLPAHLAALQSNTALMAMNTAASAGISADGWPRISIKGSRFRLQSPQGEEVVAGIELDVIMVDANPHGLSKVFYAGAYDPSVEEKAPDCWSDNGVGPSARAAKPQCGTCAACPHNVWGSKINPSGSQTKACSDVKKVAVLIAANPEGPVFELRIPPASLKNFANYVESLTKRSIPAAAVVTKLQFDSASDFPKIVFTAGGWASEDQARVVLEVIGTEEVDQCTGKNDRPVDAAAVKALPAPSVVGTVPARAALPPVPSPVAAPPVLQAAVAPTSAPVLPPAGTPESAPVAKRTRGRKPADTFTPRSEPSGLSGTVMAAAPPAFLAAPPNAAAITAPLNPAGVTDAALDALIQSAMAV